MGMQKKCRLAKSSKTIQIGHKLGSVPSLCTWKSVQISSHPTPMPKTESGARYCDMERTRHGIHGRGHVALLG